MIFLRPNHSIKLASSPLSFTRLTETLDSSSHSPRKNVVQDNTRWSSTRETRVALMSNTCDLCSHNVVLSRSEISLSHFPTLLHEFSTLFAKATLDKKLARSLNPRRSSSVLAGPLLRWDPFTPRHSPCSAGVEFGSVFPELSD